MSQEYKTNGHEVKCILLNIALRVKKMRAYNASGDVCYVGAH